jgi:LPS O-antigen subunit length determinant protein (WzzB/FepE family)
MEKINGLLRALDNKVPASMAKRLDGLKKLNQKLAVARKEHDENPTEESQEALDEIVDFLNDTQEDIVDDLSTLLEEKRSAEFKIQEESKRKAQNEARARRESIERQELQAIRRKELEVKQLEEKALKTNEKTETKKSSIGWGSLLLGGALLVLTGGAIKYFGNKK